GGASGLMRHNSFGTSATCNYTVLLSPLTGTTMAAPLDIALHNGTPVSLLPALANRHGCITGATGTGKTVTLQVLAERFSSIGTPVFLVYVKGDLCCMTQAGHAPPKLAERLQTLCIPDPEWGARPVTFWDSYGERGHPVRATISD